MKGQQKMFYLYHSVLLLAIVLIFSCAPPQEGSYLIKSVSIYDGKGSEPFNGDILINGEHIKQVASKINCPKCQVIDGKGKSLSPGFIDLHAHLEALPQVSSAESAIHMGVTTALGGPDGSSPINLKKYFAQLEETGVGVNVGHLIGHNSVRIEVMQLQGREPTSAELLQMKALIQRAMEDGAYGISTGLKYLPGTWAKIDEVIELSKVAGQLGGIYTSHLREEGLGLFEAVQEAIDISKYADIPVVLTHHKAIGQPMWGASKQTLAMVDDARDAGLDVMIDQYPYTASYTSISVLIPPWSLEGGRYDKFAERCEDPTLRDSIKAGIVYNILNDRGGGDLNRIQLAKFDWKPHLEGKTLFDWATQEGMEPTPENGAELVIQAQLHRGAKAIYHAMSDEDVVRIMQHPQTMIASDGRITKFKSGFPHPRVYGTFPRVIGHYARDRKILPITEAIRKMTSLPAYRMGLTDRGTIKEGYYADLVLFDEDEILDKATFEEPHQYPTGIDMVMINGQIALRDGHLSDQKHGKILKSPSFKHR